MGGQGLADTVVGGQLGKAQALDVDVHVGVVVPRHGVEAHALGEEFPVVGTKIGELIAFIKEIKSDIICMVDNCYGEFVETIEPTDVGAKKRP